MAKLENSKDMKEFGKILKTIRDTKEVIEKSKKLPQEHLEKIEDMLMNWKFAGAQERQVRFRSRQMGGEKKKVVDTKSTTLGQRRHKSKSRRRSRRKCR